MQRAYVLLSGGIDSVTCLHIAAAQATGSLVGVSIDYGQRHKKEVEFAKMNCARLGAKHHILHLEQIVPKTMLTDPEKALPNASYSELEGVSPTYVPFRNGLMLSALASFVQGEWATANPADALVDNDEWGIFFGAHAEDSANWAYPDCTPEFIGAMANAIYVGTYRAIRLHTPLQWMDKAAIIRKGANLGVDYSLTWSCYGGGDLHCGTCPTCRARHEGFVKAHLHDPTRYAIKPPVAA